MMRIDRIGGEGGTGEGGIREDLVVISLGSSPLYFCLLFSGLVLSSLVILSLRFSHLLLSFYLFVSLIFSYHLISSFLSSSLVLCVGEGNQEGYVFGGSPHLQRYPLIRSSDVHTERYVHIVLCICVCVYTH